MSQRFDAVIIGGGVIGCSIAYHLSKRDMKVIVLDKKTVGGQASSVAAGMLAAQEEANKPDVFFDLCLQSRELFYALVPEIKSMTGIDPELEVCGIWRVAEKEADKDGLLEKMRWQQEKGLRIEWHEPEHLRDVLPGLYPCMGALYCAGDGQVNTVRWVRALSEAARIKGVRFSDHVSDISLIREEDQITGVKTQTEIYFSDNVILSAGAWTSTFLKELDVTIPMEPVKGQLMTLGGIPRAFRGPVYAGSGYLVPKADGRLVIGGTMEKKGFNTRPSLDAQRVLADWASRWCVGLSSLPVLDFQAGLRPGTGDGWPVMGPVTPYKGLYICSGHYRNGILLSPISGKLMADGIVDKEWSSLGRPFFPERFYKNVSAEHHV